MNQAKVVSLSISFSRFLMQQCTYSIRINSHIDIIQYVYVYFYLYVLSTNVFNCDYFRCKGNQVNDLLSNTFHCFSFFIIKAYLKVPKTDDKTQNYSQINRSNLIFHIQFTLLIHFFAHSTQLDLTNHHVLELVTKFRYVSRQCIRQRARVCVMLREECINDSMVSEAVNKFICA